MMSEMVSAAERLRAVRRASRHFLALWALECVMGRPRGIDQVPDVHRHDVDGAVADPDNHDWSVLYRGSVLDD